MRSDIFAVYKDVHIKLNKEVHSAFRVKMVEMGLSLQEVFNEFAKQVANDDKKAMSILNRYVKRKLRNQIEGLKPKNSVKSELDADTIYDLIHSSDDDDDVDENDDADE